MTRTKDVVQPALARGARGRAITADAEVSKSSGSHYRLLTKWFFGVILSIIERVFYASAGEVTHCVFDQQGRLC